MEILINIFDIILNDEDEESKNFIQSEKYMISIVFNLIYLYKVNMNYKLNQIDFKLFKYIFFYF